MTKLPLSTFMPRGVVVGISSADTLIVKVIDEPSKPLYAVCLENIVAPRLGSFDGKSPDEPHAYAAFDFTRKTTIGARVVLYIAGNAKTNMKRHHPNFGQLPVIFAKVSLFDKENKDLGILLVETGWARVRSSKIEDEYTQTLMELQETAKESKIGHWAENGMIRELPAIVEPAKLLKTKEFDAIVEMVINGSTYSVWLLPNFELITLQLAGIKCPSAKRGSPDPFGNEAKEFAESRLLQRNIKVVLYKHQETEINEMFTGSALHPKGDIALFLLEEGLAQIFNPTCILLPNSEDYRARENRAKEARKNLWKNFDVAQLRSSRADGRVVSVKTSNSIEVDVGAKELRKLYLSGCKVPQFLPSGSSEQYGLEAREKLRSMLIGKSVACVIDYKVDDRQFATVYLGNTCINETLVAAGLATVVVPKNINGNPSDRIDAMYRAEADAKAKKLCIHTLSSPGVPFQLNDLSKKHTRQRSIPFMHYIEKKVNRGVIEYFASATRAVVFIPAQKCVIRLNMMGVSKTDSEERIGHEALEYCNNNYLQRDVDVQVFDVDKVGCFIGTLAAIQPNGPPKSIEADLLARGFVEVIPHAVIKCPARREMEAAENKAKEQKLGVWSDRNDTSKILSPGNIYEVNVVDIVDPASVIIQLQSNELQNINRGLLSAKTPVGKVMKGDLVAAISDDKLYRAKIVRLIDDITVRIEYLEFGNEEDIKISDLRVLPPSIAQIPPQSLVVALGGIKAFHFSDDFNNEAMEYVWSLVENAKLYAHLMYVEDVPAILLTDSPKTTGGSVNSMLLSEGRVRYYDIELDEPFTSIMQEFYDTEEAARQSKTGAWIYGNIGDDDDDENEDY